MDPVTQHLISSYLLMPVLTVIFGIAAYFIARKNKLLNNKKLIVYLLLCGIVLALPGLSGYMERSYGKDRKRKQYQDRTEKPSCTATTA